MVRTAGARRRAALISTCLSVAASGMLFSSVIAAPVVEPESWKAAAADVTPTALSAPWAMAKLEGAEAITGGHGRFVAVGSTGYPQKATAWSSIDGRTWERAELMDAPVGSSLTQVIATDGGFVALGVESGMYGSSKERVDAWYSTDGLTWERAVVTKPAKSGLQALATSLADGPAGQLALGSFIGQDLGAQRLWRSADGRTWKPATLPKVTNPVWDAVVAHPKGYLLLGQSGRGQASNWKSVDGMTWQRLTDTPRMFDVAVGERGTLAGIGYKHIYESPRGLRAWEETLTRPKSWKVDGSNAFAFVEWDGSEFVVPGNDFSGCRPRTDECHTNPLLVSVDGKAWSESAGPDGLPGADKATWITDVASLGDSTAILGQNQGQTVVWLVSGTPAST